MLSDFLRLVLDSVEFLWPLKRIEPFERGIFVVLGKFWKEVGPGVYFRLPWFMEVHEISTAWSVMSTPRHDVTMKDGRTLSFAANCMARVVDAKTAFLTIHDHDAAMYSMLGSVLAEKLAEIDPERLNAEKRARLNTDLRKWVEQDAAEFGMEVRWVRFTSFIVNPRTYRLLNEQTGTIG